MTGAVACQTCQDVRRQSLGIFAGPRETILALPDCDCQRLSAAEQRKRLFTAGAGPLAELSTRFFADVGLWAAVAKGADVRPLGAMADLALGLGIGEHRSDAIARAVGEMLERYGAALVRPGSGDMVPLADREGRICGEGPAAAVWLPYHRDGKPVLPTSSAGLAFAFSRQEAVDAAFFEAIERQAIRQLVQVGTGSGAPRGPIRIGRITGNAYRLPASFPVILVLIAWPDGQIMAAGAAARSSEDLALAAAAREAALDWLAARGELLPGSGLQGAGLLGPLATTHIRDWPAAPRPLPRREPAEIADERAAGQGFGFADLTPPDIAQAGGHVVRALESGGSA